MMRRAPDRLPDLPQILALARAGNRAEALRVVGARLLHEPRSPLLLDLQGTLQLDCGQPAAALASLQRACALAPDHADYHLHLGIAHQQLRHGTEAVDAFGRATRLQPDLFEGWCRLASVHESGAAWSAAAAAYAQAIRLQPQNPDLLCNLGAVLLSQRDYTGAAAVLETAVRLRPGFPEAENCLGVAYKGLNRPSDAAAAFTRVLALRGNDAEAWCNLGNACMSALQTGPALAAYRKAISLRSDYAHARFSEALALLALGEYPEGFAKYEARWDSIQKATMRPIPGIRWDGVAPLSGKRILVYHEQGFGDTLQFSRFVPQLADRGALVRLEVQPSLVELLRSLDPRIQVFSTGQYPHDYDYCSPLLSLPHLLGLTLADLPGRTSYLTMPPALIAGGAELLGPSARPRIGLVANGNPGNINDHNRTLPLSALIPVLDPGLASYFLLQKDVPPHDRATLQACPYIHDLSAQLGSYTDTAGLVMNLDLVISVDTSVCHLAGAMARETWVLLPYYPDWRWLLEREDSPWYPSLRLYRQTTPGDWGPLFGRLQRDLAAWINARLPAD